MNMEEEKGFLSDKFDDWSGEPIPNGWNEIEAKLGHKKKRRPLFWWWFPGALIIVLGAYFWLSQSQDSTNVTPELVELSAPKTQNLKDFNNGQNIIRSDHPSETLKETTEGISAAEQKEFPPYFTPASDGSELTKQPGSTEQKFQQRKRNRNPRSRILLAQGEKGNSGKTKSDTENNGSAGYGQNRIIAGIDKTSSETNGPLIPLTRPVVSPADNEKTDNRKIGPVSNPIASSSPGLTSPKGIANEPGFEVYFLQTKNPGFPKVFLAENNQRPIPVELIPFGPELGLNSNGQVYFSFGGQLGFAQNEILIRQADANRRIQIENNEGVQSLLGAISGKVHLPVFSKLEVFGGLQFGFYQQRLKLQTSSKLPSSYSVSTKDSTWFSAEPIWEMESEIHNQVVLFGQTELGTAFCWRKGSTSGPFASMVIWTRLANFSISKSEGTLLYASDPERWVIGFRCGYRHKLPGNWFGEIYFSPSPNRLIQPVKGMEVNSRMLGLALSRSF
jgi:hypothetical protein